MADDVPILFADDRKYRRRAVKRNRPQLEPHNSRTITIVALAAVLIITIAASAFYTFALSHNGNLGATSTRSLTPVQDEQEVRRETRANGRRRRLPSALIIGAKKSGTRALLEFMRAHPHVEALAQEAHFFDKHYDEGLQWYRLDRGKAW